MSCTGLSSGNIRNQILARAETARYRLREILVITSLLFNKLVREHAPTWLTKTRTCRFDDAPRYQTTRSASNMQKVIMLARCKNKNALYCRSTFLYLNIYQTRCVKFNLIILRIIHKTCIGFKRMPYVIHFILRFKRYDYRIIKLHKVVLKSQRIYTTKNSQRDGQPRLGDRKFLTANKNAGKVEHANIFRRTRAIPKSFAHRRGG